MQSNFIKRSIVLLCCLLTIGAIHAQRFGAGLVIGFNASQIDGDRYAGYNKIGLVAGIQATASISDKVDLGMELRFSQIGSRSTPNTQNTIDPFNITLNYAEVPVTVNYKDWYMEEDDYYRLEFHGGLTYGRLFGTSIDDGDGTFQEVEPFFNDNYFGAIVGFTYFFNENIGATVRFNRSITNLYKNRASNPNVPSLFSKHLTFSGTYRF